MKEKKKLHHIKKCWKNIQRERFIREEFRKILIEQLNRIIPKWEETNRSLLRFVSDKIYANPMGNL